MTNELRFKQLLKGVLLSAVFALPVLHSIAWAQTPCAAALSAAAAAPSLQGAQRTLDICTRSLGARHADTLMAQHQLANALEDTGNNPQALALRRQTLAERRALLGTQHIDTLKAQGNLARSLAASGDTDSGIKLLEEAQALAERHLPNEPRFTVQLLLAQAQLYSDSNRAQQAIKPLERAWEISRRNFGETDELSGNVLAAIAVVSNQPGSRNAAADYALMAYGIRGKRLGGDHPETLASQRILMQIYSDDARFADAAAFGRSALPISRKIHGATHPITLDVGKNLAQSYAGIGDLQAAASLLDALLESLSRTADASVRITQIELLADRADIHSRDASPSQALALMDRALALASQITPKASLAPDSLRKLGDIRAVYLIKLRRYDEAIAQLQPSVAYWRSVKSVQLRESLNALAGAYYETGQAAKAQPMFEELLAERRARLGAAHPDTLQSVRNLVFAYKTNQALGKVGPLALEYIKGAEALRNRLVISKQDKQALLAQHVPMYRFFSRIAGQAADHDLASRSGSTYASGVRVALFGFQASEFSKGRSLWDSLIASRALDGSGIPIEVVAKVRALLQKIQGLEQQQSALQLSARTPEREAAIIALGAVLSIERGELSEIESSLLKNYPRYDELRAFSVPDPSTEAAKVLRPDQLFISYMLEDTGALSAWLLGDGGVPRFVDCGTHPDLEAQIAELRRIVNSPTPSGAQGTATYQARSLALRKALSAALVKPLLRHLNGKKSLIIAPDGDLALLPFDALPFEAAADSVTLGARFEISIAQNWSVYNLLKARETEYQRTPAAKGLLAMGNPIYQNRPNAPGVDNVNGVERSIALPSVLRGARLAASSVAAKPVALEEMTPERELALLRSFRWENLPGTAAEIKAISLLFVGSGGVNQSSQFTGADASEAKLQALNASGELAGFRYLLFSTHGALAADPSLSSLVLSQVNLDPATDGYVTASEWERYTLRSELVVLSACDTGVGKAAAGDGLMGLPFALFAAGNQNALVTLWPVADDATAEFMTRFFKRLTQGEAQTSALAAVKREFSAHPQYSHPRFWAGFVLYGV